MRPPIDETERARLGNVAAILIGLARRAQAAERGRDDNGAPAAEEVRHEQ